MNISQDKEVFNIGSGFSKAVFSEMPLLNDLTVDVENLIYDKDNINYIHEYKVIYDKY